ncbi:DMT family transporter [Shewanella sp. 1_MG-2023]|uniref:DMT family transporter n=1 Tax=unclassified Shewanella TaxID=196818 RepID=UPI0026E21662|nr:MULTISPECIES: DMT family transporter [unclassified Shewanella]MDO6609834.1 DMT family transporter [Shewanella sp. 7_MG-2023]MDO6770024.1 DMT family transporter [Shewanella sp. 2_MG-2023]MDO6796771.1 DMT family transporter [Shewanella sp. 1_MG-2023]
MWIALTILAAFMQSWRNAFQSELSQQVKVSGVTLARFIWAGPIAAVYLISLYQLQPSAIPTFSYPFYLFVIGASLMQILATGLMVKLFQLKNFAVGAGLAKSEALVAAILGVLFFGTSLSLLGWLGVIIGAVAVMLLSTQKGVKRLSLNTIILGISSGIAFAFTSLWVREASLLLMVDSAVSAPIPFTHRAAWVLLSVIGLQTIILVTYLAMKDRLTLLALWQRPRLTILISVCSCIASIGWFSAMSLQAVPYVKTLGQIEVFFTMLISVFWLKQKIKVNEVLGLVLIAVAAILVMWT